MATLPGFERYEFHDAQAAEVPPGWTAHKVHRFLEYYDYRGDDDNLKAESFTLPNIVLNLGLPGTGLNVSNAMLGNFHNLARQALDSMGMEPMAVGLWEYRNEITGPDLLGWHFVFLYHNSPEVRAQVVSLVGAILAIIAVVAIFVSIDQMTGGKLTDAFTDAFNQFAGGVSRVVAAPFSGAATVMIVGVVLVGALALAAPRLGMAPGTVGQAGQLLKAGGEAGAGVLAAGRGISPVGQLAVRRRRGRRR